MDPNCNLFLTVMVVMLSVRSGYFERVALTVLVPQSVVRPEPKTKYDLVLTSSRELLVFLRFEDPPSLILQITQFRKLYQKKMP